MIISDSPDQCTGLGRITRNLATLLVTHCADVFRVCTFGRGGWGSSKLPFFQYNFDETRQWGENQLERCWVDFAGADPGIIMTIWDASRLFWFGHPEYFAEGSNLRTFLENGQFNRWGYFPVDAMCPGDGLSVMSAETIRGYDRILGYTAWGAERLTAIPERRPNPDEKVNWIPHGYNPDKFSPRDKKAARMSMCIPEDRHNDLMVGCVMTNQSRKDWGLAFAAMAEVKKKISNVLFWVHVDVQERYWSIPALTQDFGLSDAMILTDHMTDEMLSYYYSGCDLTILPSLGEGFGFPIVESLACGVPVIHGDYGGGAELVQENYLVEPYTYRLDTLHNCLRPVYRPEDWVEKILTLLESQKDAPDVVEWSTEHVEHLQWGNLWPVWEKWFREGVNAQGS